MEKIIKYLMLMLVTTFSLIFVSCGGDDDIIDGIHSNDIVGKWHINGTNSDKLIFNSDNTGLWVQGSEIKKFSWRVGEVSNEISVSQKFPGNEKSDWILSFQKEECTKNVLNGSYETYTYNVGYIDNKSNSIIKLVRHTNGCSYVDYYGPSDWENYNDNNGNGESGSGGDNENNSGNEGGGGNSNGGTDNHHYPCKSCDESGKCWNCHGTGVNPITNKKCNTCHGSGKCQVCNGKGYIIV